MFWQEPASDRVLISMLLTSLSLFFLAVLHDLWDLSSPTRDWTRSLAVRTQSPNHWTTSKFLKMQSLIHLSQYGALWSLNPWKGGAVKAEKYPSMLSLNLNVNYFFFWNKLCHEYFPSHFISFNNTVFMVTVHLIEVYLSTFRYRTYHFVFRKLEWWYISGFRSLILNCLRSLRLLSVVILLFL